MAKSYFYVRIITYKDKTAFHCKASIVIRNERCMSKVEMIPVEKAQDIILSHVGLMPTEVVPLIDVVGRIAAHPLKSDIDVAPFDHSAMDGFALRAEQIASASPQNPVKLEVIAEVAAGDIFEGEIGRGQCVRIMTGAQLPEDADSVVKYEVVKVESGDGKTGSIVGFAESCKTGENVRAKGEEAKRGEVIVEKGELVKRAGVGYLASCGILDVETYARPRVAIAATGSELVPPNTMPGAGHIRESNSYAIAACANAAGAIASAFPIIKDTYEDLAEFIDRATRDFDFVITTGGAANGDYDFIKSVVADLGEAYVTLVNMRPGKAQTFGIVNGCPVFGLPGNPAAAYCGFEMLIRPALRKMQGYTEFEHPRVKARLTKDFKKRDPRYMLLRAQLEKDSVNGGFAVTPFKNQSSGLFSTIQKSNCMVELPSGLESKVAGDEVDCLLLDIDESMTL